MKLKEFELDLPYIIDEKKINEICLEQNTLKENAIKIDYENNWKLKRKNFKMETRCITAMFERLFESTDITEFWKISLECVPVVTNSQVRNIGGVLFKQVEFIYEDFIKYNNEIKKEISLEILVKGIKESLDEKKINLLPFEKVYNEIKQNKYKNNWKYGKCIKSPNKLFNAEILCEHDVEKIEIFILIKNKKGEEILKKKIISELPEEFAYTKHLGKIKWITSESIEYYNKKNLVIFSCDIKL